MFLNSILSSQFQASLCMLHYCIKACAPKDWDGKIANATFRQVAYHTLFFVDFYLSPSEDAFQLRDLHQNGGDERGPTVSPGLAQPQTLSYLDICAKPSHRKRCKRSKVPAASPAHSPAPSFTSTTSATSSITPANSAPISADSI
jgi:hypothetical protein